MQDGACELRRDEVQRGVLVVEVVGVVVSVVGPLFDYVVVVNMTFALFGCSPSR